MHEFYFLIYLYVRNFDYLCRPKRKCGEIWLLATTLKNAKMLTTGHLAMVTAFISMFCVFVTAPHSCGAYFLPGNNRQTFLAKRWQVPFPRKGI